MFSRSFQSGWGNRRHLWVHPRVIQSNTWPRAIMWGTVWRSTISWALTICQAFHIDQWHSEVVIVSIISIWKDGYQGTGSLPSLPSFSQPVQVVWEGLAIPSVVRATVVPRLLAGGSLLDSRGMSWFLEGKGVSLWVTGIKGWAS